MTGADGGIGTEYCRCLKRAGWEILMISNRAKPLETRAAELDAEYLPLDLTRADATDLILGWLDARGKIPDLLVNNAGIFVFREVTQLDEHQINLFIDLHVRSVTTLSRAVALRMKERGRGRILNMSSMSCWMPAPGIAMYSATKAYIRVFTRALNYELRGSGVTATAICPGGIATDLFGLPDNLKRLALRLGVLERPERLARKALRRTLRGRKQYTNGILNRAAIPLVAITPGWLRAQVKRILPK